MVYLLAGWRHTAKVEGCWAGMRPVVDLGRAIGLVVGFGLDIVLPKAGRIIAGRDHVSRSCRCLVGEDGMSKRDERGQGGGAGGRAAGRGESGKMYTWPRKQSSP